MSVPRQSDNRNGLLALLPDQDFALVAARLEAVDLPRGTIVAAPGEPIVAIVFPNRGIGSVVAMSPEGNEVEAGQFGREGFAPLAPVFGVDRPSSKSLMQVEGDGFRIKAGDFRELLGLSAPLKRLAQLYAYTFYLQVTQTALSNALHHIDERLARWLLMCHDRADGDRFELTQDFIALMLAVRRPSVTTALHVLEGNGFIRSARGSVTIRDRGALEEFARDAYGQPEGEYRRLIGRLR